jgi:hypothetical protein
MSHLAVSSSRKLQRYCDVQLIFEHFLNSLPCIYQHSAGILNSLWAGRNSAQWVLVKDVALRAYVKANLL